MSAPSHPLSAPTEHYPPSQPRTTVLPPFSTAFPFARRELSPPPPPPPPPPHSSSSPPPTKPSSDTGAPAAPGAKPAPPRRRRGLLAEELGLPFPVAPLAAAAANRADRLHLPASPRPAVGAVRTAASQSVAADPRLSAPSPTSNGEERPRRLPNVRDAEQHAEFPLRRVAPPQDAPRRAGGYGQTLERYQRAHDFVPRQHESAYRHDHPLPPPMELPPQVSAAVHLPSLRQQGKDQRDSLAYPPCKAPPRLVSHPERELAFHSQSSPVSSAGDSTGAAASAGLAATGASRVARSEGPVPLSRIVSSTDSALASDVRDERFHMDVERHPARAERACPTQQRAMPTQRLYVQQSPGYDVSSAHFAAAGRQQVAAQRMQTAPTGSLLFRRQVMKQTRARPRKPRKPRIMGTTPIPREQRVYIKCKQCGEKNHVRRLSCSRCGASKQKMRIAPGVGGGTDEAKAGASEGDREESTVASGGQDVRKRSFSSAFGDESARE